MTVLRCVQLVDDLSMGGVSNGLKVFDHPGLKPLIESRVVAVRPALSIAPVIDADVIFIHFPPSWKTLPFLVSLRLRNPGARLMHIEHSYTRAWERLKVPAKRRFRTMLNLAYRLSHDVVAVSRGQADWLVDCGAVHPRKLQILYPWSGEQGLLDVPMASPHLGRPLRLAAYGRFAEAKGFDVLIDAVKRLDPTAFSLVLGGCGVDDEKLRVRAQDCPNIRFAGRVDDVAGFLSDCDVVVVPSRWEAFGQVAAEGRMAGRPIVVPDVDGLAEQVGEAGLVVDCSSAAALSRALAALPNQPLDVMAKAARASMRDAEAERIGAWRTLFTRIARQRAARSSLARRDAAPMITSAGHSR